MWECAVESHVLFGQYSLICRRPLSLQDFYIFGGFAWLLLHCCFIVLGAGLLDPSASGAVLFLCSGIVRSHLDTGFAKPLSGCRGRLAFPK